MKIAISAVSGVSYGGVTYFKNLIPALAEADKDNEYHIFVQRGHPLSTSLKQSNFIFHECNSSVASAFIRLLWEQFILPFELKKRKVDVVFTAKNANILLTSSKKVISIRNMEPLRYNDYKNYWKLNIFSWLRRKLTGISVKKADGIIAVSESTKDYVEKFFPASRGKVVLIYNGNPIVKKEASTDSHNEKMGFLLSASKFVSYANQFNLIEGYAVLHNKKGDLPPLWLAGGVHDPAYFRKVKDLVRQKGLQEKIKILGLIPRESLMKLYSNATAFLFPSTLEACPHTLIEAMAYGVPIAASNVPPMPEICGDAAIYFNPFDAHDIAVKIEQLLTDEHVRTNLKEKSLKRCRFFDWDKTASQMIKVFEKVYAYKT